MDPNKLSGKKACQILHNNAASYIEQVQEATSNKKSGVQNLPSITKTIQIRRTRHAAHYWRRKDEIITDELLWTPSYVGAKVGRPAGTYMNQLCVDTGRSQEDLPGATDDRGGWWERVKEILASSMTWWWYYRISLFRIRYEIGRYDSMIVLFCL